MNCPKCQSPNAEDALFCSNCGAPLEKPAEPANDLPVYGADTAQPSEQPAAPQQPNQTNPYSSMPVYGAGQNPYTQGQTGQNYTAPAYQPYTPGGYYAAPPTGDRSKDWAAITALVCGILSIPCCMCYGAGGIIGLAAIVFGIIGLKSSKKGMSIAGLICGVIGFLFGIYMLVAFVGLLNSPEFLQEYQHLLDELQNL